MMNVKKLFLILLVASSCAPVYVPNARNTPLFRGAGEVQVAAQVGQGYDVQGAVAITDHIGVMTNYAYTSNTSVDDNDKKDYIKHNFFEGAVGYYENKGKFCYEIFGGYGRGKGTTYDEYDFAGDSEIKATGKYQRFFIQPSVGTNKNVFNWIVTTRLSLVDFTEFSDAVQTYKLDRDPVLFFEPAFTGRFNFGSGRIMVNFQTGVSFSQREVFFDYEPFFLSIGIGARLGKLNDTEE